jgi:hypothetical protein
MKAKESGQPLSGTSAMNEERIRQLEELDFAWALRGVDGKKEADSAEAGTIEDEVTQDTGELPSGEAHHGRLDGEVGHVNGDAVVQHAIDHAEI